VKIDATSQQAANANGAEGGGTVQAPTLGATGSPPVSATTPSTGGATPPESPRVSAISGAALAVGNQTNVQSTNVQASTCIAPEVACAAGNSASLIVESQPA